MFLKRVSPETAGASREQVKRLKRELESADAVVLGAGAG